MYERRRHPLLSRARFARRLALHAAAAGGLIAVSLLVGMWGYAHYEGLDGRDSFLNASMILGGMGPVDMPRTPDGKVFAGIYALYSGIVFLVTAGILLAPVVHRAMHRFHWEDGDAR
jgi:hypothetical protein